MFPDDDFRKKILPLYFNYRIKFGILFGEVYATTSNIEGLAVWYKRNDFIMSNWKNFRAGGMKLLFHVDNEALKRMFTIGHFSNQLRDEYTTSDYWYLAPIGIDPIHQGKGFASKLIRPMLVRFDSEQLPCLLETQSANNVSLYKRYGFEIVKETIDDTTSELTSAVIAMDEEKGKREFNEYEENVRKGIGKALDALNGAEKNFDLM